MKRDQGESVANEVKALVANSVEMTSISVERLDRWMEQRAKIVAKVRAYNPTWRDPGTLLITDQYKNKPDSHAFAEHSGSMDDSVIVPLREQLGFHFATIPSEEASEGGSSMQAYPSRPSPSSSVMSPR